MTLREEVYQYIKDKYQTEPEYLWKRFPDYAAFRHEDNKKWFALVMGIMADKLGIDSDERADIVDVKLDDPFLIDVLTRQDGYFKGYHLSKGNWISILLDGTVPMENICGLIDDSYVITASKQKKQKIRAPKEWIVPANPKYYDIEGAFANADVIDWKQGSGIRTGDTVYMYVAAPVSAILYQCEVLDTDIPFEYSDKNVSMKAVMKIKLLRRYERDAFTFDTLKEDYAIYAVRGPRGIPNSLSEALKR